MSRGRLMLAALALTASVGCVSTTERTFDPAVWRVGGGNRSVGMAYYIVNHELLVGASSKEVVDLLGDPDVVNGLPESGGWYDYWLERDWELEVNFEEGTAVEVNVVEPSALM